MSQILTLELSDRVFTAIRQQAETAGVLPEHLVAALLEQKFGPNFKLLPTETEKAEARARFEQHFGTIGGDVGEINNESIDALLNMLL